MPVTGNPVSLYLVCGFLGAGKTTFIIERLKQAGPRVAVLVNEFGSLGIDGEVIRTCGGVDVIEMPGGCICCSQKEGLEARIREIVDSINPGLLLIEPSGVAETSGLIDALTGALKELVRLDAVITIVDAATFLEFSGPDSFGVFFNDQVENADLLIINKRDSVDLDTLGKIEERAAELNPYAEIVTTEFCRIGSAVPSCRKHDRNIAHNTSIRFGATSVRPQASITREKLDHFLSEIKKGRFGDVLRAKGFLNVENEGCINLQFTRGGASLEPFRRGAEPRLVLIGFGIDHDEVARYFDDTAG